MYYEEKMIDGVLCWRGSVDAEWTPLSLSEMTTRYFVKAQALERTQEQKTLHDEYTMAALTGILAYPYYDECQWHQIIEHARSAADEAMKQRQKERGI